MKEEKQNHIRHSATQSLLRFLFLQINANGVLSFGSAFPFPAPVSLPLSDHALVLPYWADVNLWEGDSDVYFRQTTDSAILDDVTTDVHYGFNCSGDFQATWSLIVTWHNVSYYREDFGVQTPVGEAC